MKKSIMIHVAIVIIQIAILIPVTAFAWGNQAWFDMEYNFDRAIINIGDNIIADGNVVSWMDYEDSDVVQVNIDGKTYLTHYTNCILIAE